MRIGFSKDVHRFKKGRKLILGGVEIPFKKGLIAHSDGDVVVHSIVDAILGAINFGDIGTLFPDNDNKYKDYNSMLFLVEIKKILEFRGLFIENIDVFISCEKPKLRDYISVMRQNIAETLEIDIKRISIKAGTNEKLGYVGNMKGIESYCVCLIGEKNG